MTSKRSLILILLLFFTNTAFAVTKYEVKKGDSLYKLSKRLNISVKDLKDVNELNNNRLNVGDTLLIPNSNEASAGKKEYVVLKGDTLTGIGKRFRVSVKNLKNANGLKSNNIRVGMSLTIPGNFSASLTDLEVFPDVGESKSHTVKKGDTLSLIAKNFRVSVNDLKRANSIKGTKIRVGQVLNIPGQDRHMAGLQNSRIDNDSYKENKNGNYIPRSKIISVAKRFLGAPYKFGGNSPVKGLDCSAFVNTVFDFFNVDLPRTARDIYKVGQVVDREELATGDLVFFRTYASYPSHVGIYIGDDEFIHASSRAKKVTIDSMDFSYYKRRYIGAKRIEVSGLFYDEMSKDYKGFEKQ